jgi:mono/diheme cytochrome c family protein
MAANVTLADPLAAKGKTIFEAQSCNACHGDGGVGTAAATGVIGIGKQFSAESVIRIIQASYRENERGWHAAY